MKMVEKFISICEKSATLKKENDDLYNCGKKEFVW